MAEANSSKNNTSNTVDQNSGGSNNNTPPPRRRLYVSDIHPETSETSSDYGFGNVSSQAIFRSEDSDFDFSGAHPPYPGP